jgi:glycosyltransferase involved in cell wall biosynthesis
MKIAYLVNQYPKVSHSFIRREITGLEANQIEVKRFSIRSCSAELVDPADQAELEKTQFVLDVGGLGLLVASLRMLLIQPLRFAQTFRLMLKVSRYSERGFLRHVAYLAEACVLVQWLRREQITHVHAHFGTNPTTVAMFCGSLREISYSFTAHGPEEFDDIRGLGLSEKIKRAAFVVAVSSYGKSQLYRWCDHSQWSKIQVIHCGVEAGFLQQPLTPIPIEPCLVCVGRLSEQKGHLLLIEAASKLTAQGKSFKLVLVGDGELRSRLEALIQKYQLQGTIEITGWADTAQVQQQILAARALVLPSFAEGLPVVIMEALALGRPVLSTYVAGIPELVEPETCGWLIPAGSVEALANAMAVLLERPIQELEKMGQAGVERVAQDHNALKEAKKLAQLFHAVKT